MNKDLTASNVQRQNVLNNRFAIEHIESELDMGGTLYQQKHYFTKEQVSIKLEVDERTIDRYISSHNEELTRNGYMILKGKALKDFKNLLYVDDTNVVDIDPKVPQLGVFSFKSVLNLAMLLTV